MKNSKILPLKKKENLFSIVSLMILSANCLYFHEKMISDYFGKMGPFVLLILFIIPTAIVNRLGMEKEKEDKAIFNIALLDLILTFAIQFIGYYYDN